MKSEERFPVSSYLTSLPYLIFFDHLLQEILFTHGFHVESPSSLSYNFAILAIFPPIFSGWGSSR